MIKDSAFAYVIEVCGCFMLEDGTGKFEMSDSYVTMWICMRLNAACNGAWPLEVPYNRVVVMRGAGGDMWSWKKDASNSF